MHPDHVDFFLYRLNRDESRRSPTSRIMFVCLFVYLFILGRKLNRQNCLLKEVLREREEKEEKEKKKVIRW